MLAYKIVLVVVLAVCTFIVVKELAFSMKCNNVLQNRLLIIDAIANHNQDMIDKDRYKEQLPYELMTTVDEDLKRWGDWGYKKMLPDWAFERIKPYIREEKKR